MRAAGYLAALALLPLLGGCVIVAKDGRQKVSVISTDDSGVSSKNLEPVSRISFDGQQMTAVVGSNGCTQTSSFEVHIEEGEPSRISLVRREPDPCRALVAEGVALSWTYEELGLKPGQAVRLLNPLSV